MKYVPKFPPYAHQAEALRKLEGREAFALLMAMRCVDGDTEYLSPLGWRKIRDYAGGRVAEFRLDGTAHFVRPLDYIKSPVDHFWHFKTQGGVDQVLSDNHRILLCSSVRAHFGKVVGKVPNGFRSSPRPNTNYWRETSPLELKAKGRALKDRVPMSFWLKTDTRIDMTDAEIRLMVAFHADGSFGRRDLSNIGPRRKGAIRIKKEYKKTRIRELLNAAGVAWFEKEVEPEGFTTFWFLPMRVSKTYGMEWWLASDEQRAIIADEVTRWDGHTLEDRSGASYYSSIHEGDVDFIQYCFVSTGRRAIKRDRQGDGTFAVYVTGGGRTSNLALLSEPVPYEGETDGFMYSFSVPSTYLVLRRNGKVFVTGNTGKTKTILDDWGRLVCEDKVDDLLVVAPAGVYRTWVGDAEKHLGEPLAAATRVAIFSAGAGRKELAELDRFMVIDDARIKRIFLMNIEALSSVERARNYTMQFAGHRRSMIAIDESTVIKNPTAKRSRFVCDRLAPLAKYRRILSGLPTPKNPLDIYGQFLFLDRRLLGFSSYFSFRARYAVMKTLPMGGRSIPVVVGYRDVDELRERIAPHSHRVLLEDCYDLPPKQYVMREVTLSKEQARIYAELKHFATASLGAGDHVTATQVITQIMRMHQVLCGHTVDEHDVTHDIPEHRTEELISLLEEYDGKAIVWCSYDANIRRVSAALKREFGENSVARFWGGNRSEREDEERRFLDDDECRFMVATAAAGGRGRTWVNADLVVYYSNTNDLEHRSQSEERAQGVGKTKPVMYVDLVAPGTVDEKIIKALRAKINVAATITGDNYREWLI